MTLTNVACASAGPHPPAARASLPWRIGDAPPDRRELARAKRGHGGGLGWGPAVAVFLALSACTVGPDYQRPEAPVPANYKEAAGWKLGKPGDAIDRGAWWSIYNDPVLDGLEKQIDISNQNLKAAEAAFRQAEFVVAQARAGFFPTGTLNVSAQRARGNGSSSGSIETGGGHGNIASLYNGSVAASWTPDLWGQIRRTVESNVASAQASAADLAGRTARRAGPARRRLPAIARRR